MTHRPLARTRRAAAVATLGLGLASLAAGCDPRSLAYFLQPFEPKVPAPGPSFKDKKVVVLAHSDVGPLGMTGTRDVENDLARGVGRKLEEELGKKVEVVPHQKVRVWAEGHPNYIDPSEAGRAFDADAVVFLEVEAYQTRAPNSPGLARGQSRVHVKVFDLVAPTDEKGRPIPGRDKEVVVSYDEYVESLYPRIQGAMPIDGTTAAKFERMFFDVVVSEVAWQFVSRRTGDDIQDTTL